MASLSFIIHVLGATMLLLYAVRMVRTGIERAFGASFRSLFGRTRGALSAGLTGLGLAMALQSATGVALLVAGFAAGGLLAFPTGFAIVLGADLGSALLVLILSHPLDWLVPALLAVGAGVFVKTERRGLRQAGRIVLGVAFILISLQFLREAMEPIQSSGLMPALARYLEADPVTAFLAGAALAFVLHSSLAAILMCVALVAVGALPVLAGAALTFGANLGGALIPVRLGRGLPPAGRRISLAVLALRGIGAVAALGLVALPPVLAWLAAWGEGQALIVAHVAFNAALALLAPLGGRIAPLAERLLPDRPEAAPETLAIRRSALDDSLLDRPKLAIVCLRREVLRMLELTREMFEPAMEIFSADDAARARALIAEDRQIDRALDGLRSYVARIDAESLAPEDRERLRDLADYAIAIESAADVIATRLLPRAVRKSRENLRFSSEGAVELVRLHRRALASLSLASNVLVSEDLEAARLLLEEKTEVARMERQSRRRHLARLGAGLASFETSDLHLETVRALKDFNSLIAAVAYPPLYRGGQLLETRLIGSLGAAAG